MFSGLRCVEREENSVITNVSNTACYERAFASKEQCSVAKQSWVLSTEQCFFACKRALITRSNADIYWVLLSLLQNARSYEHLPLRVEKGTWKLLKHRMRHLWTFDSTLNYYILDHPYFKKKCYERDLRETPV